MRTLGLDIGGANIKASDGESWSISWPFPLWRYPDQLTATLQQILAESPPVERLAVSMSGELADCYRTKSIGVNAILDAVDGAAEQRDVLVWQSGGEFVDLATARELVPLVAAANWHVLATWVGRMVPTGQAVLIDLGSTTTDIIPLVEGVPMPKGRTDPERLVSGELVYLGLRRTPLIGLLHEVTLAGIDRPLGNELFATTWDVQLALRVLDDAPDLCETANGRPATRDWALDRLARQLCADVDEISIVELLQFSEQCQSQFLRRIATAINRVINHPEVTAVILSGEGENLASNALRLASAQWAETFSLNQLLGPRHSTAACAYALARLGGEQPVWET